MTRPLNQASPTLAQEYRLTQAEHHALIHGSQTVMKFDPLDIVIKDSILFTTVAKGRALVQADYTPLISHPVTMAFAPDKAALKQMASIRGAGDVRVCLQDGHYHIHGDHTGTHLQAIPVPTSTNFQMPIITWIGAEVSGYASMDLKAFIGKIGKEMKTVQLAVYDNQLEQVGVKGQSEPYTFTAGMAERLASRRPNLVLLSRVAFRHFGKKQSLRLGQKDGQYILRVTNSLDIDVDLVLFEPLDLVAA